MIDFQHGNMAEASMAAFGAAIGVLIAMAVVVFWTAWQGTFKSTRRINIGTFQHFSYFSTSRVNFYIFMAYTR